MNAPNTNRPPIDEIIEDGIECIYPDGTVIGWPTGPQDPPAEPLDDDEPDPMANLAELAELVKIDWTWKDQAACKGMPVDVFFPDVSSRRPPEETQAALDRALAVCDGCPVQQQCLDHAVQYGERGIWGGMERNKRLKLERERHGDQRPSGGQLTSEQIEAIQSADPEETTYSVAKRLGISRRTVKRYRDEVA